MSYNDFITTTGVIITGIFSGLVWKATKDTADATKATLALNRELANKEENTGI